MDTFTVTIKLVDKLPEGDCGYCVRRSHTKDQYEIAISKTAHKTLAQYGSTLLHELLHLWVYIMNTYGYKVRLALEHRWIRAVETVVIEFMGILREDEKFKGDKK